MQHADLDVPLFLDVAGLDHAPRGRLGARERRESLERRVARDRHPLPDAARRKGTRDRGRAADVIGIGVRDQQALERAHANRAQRRRDDARADVEGRRRRAPGVDQQGAAVREEDERRVPLPDVEEHDAHRAGRTWRHRDRRREGRRPHHERETQERREDRAARGGREQQRGGDGAVVDGHQSPRRRGHVARQPGNDVDETCRTDQPGRRHVRDISALRGDRCRQRRTRECRERGPLHDRHQGNGGEIQQEAGEGDPREDHRAGRRERELRTDSCDQERGRRGRNPPEPGARRAVGQEPRRSKQDPERRAKRENEPGVEDRDRRHGERPARGDAQGIHRRSAMVENPRTQVDRGRGNRAGHRRASPRKRAVEDEQDDRRRRRQPRWQAQHPRRAKEQHREDGDVAARNRNDVIRARLLQAPLVLLGQPRAVADQDRGGDARGRDARGRPAPGPYEARDLLARPRTRGRGGLRHAAALPHDLHERAALDGADERDASPRERAAFVRQAGIAIGGRQPQHGGDTDGAAAPPLAQPLGRGDARDSKPDAATDARRVRAPEFPRAVHVKRDRRPALGHRPIVTQRPVEEHRLFARGWRSGGEPVIER